MIVVLLAGLAAFVAFVLVGCAVLVAFYLERIADRLDELVAVTIADDDFDPTAPLTFPPGELDLGSEGE